MQDLAPRPAFTDPATHKRYRHHLHESVVKKAVKEVARKSPISKPASCHSLRHWFAKDLLEDGYDIRTVQELLGHTDVRTTMIYTHVLNRASTPRSYNGTMPIGISRRSCAVEFLDKPSKSDENRAIAPSLAGAGYTGQYTH